MDVLTRNTVLTSLFQDLLDCCILRTLEGHHLKSNYDFLLLFLELEYVATMGFHWIGFGWNPFFKTPEWLYGWENITRASIDTDVSSKWVLCQFWGELSL